MQSSSWLPRYRVQVGDTFKLAVPIIVAQLGVVLMGVTDNMMVGKLLGAVPLAGAGIANSVAYLIGSIGIGGLSIVSALVAKAKGESDFAEVKRLYLAGVRVAVLLGLILGVIGLAVAYRFDLFQQPESIRKIAGPFMGLLILSNIPLFVFVGIRQLCDGLARPRVAMFITASALILNFVLNYLLIRLIGVQGAALATLLARIYMAIAIWAYVRKDPFFRPYLSVDPGPFVSRSLMVRIMKLGLPGGFQFFFEIAAFSLAVVMIGWIGEFELAAHQIAINMASTTYMMATGIGSAASIRVATALVREGPGAALEAGKAALILVTLFMSACCVLFLLIPEVLVGFYISDSPEVTSIAVSLVMIAALFQLSDGIQVTALGALRGITDVNTSTLITLFAYWGLALPVSYFSAFYFGWGVQGVWFGLSAGLTVSAVLLVVRFFFKAKSITFAKKEKAFR